MKTHHVTVPCLAVALGLAASAAGGEKLSPSFRSAFEKSFRAGRTFAVVMQEGVPTTSVYGVDGKSSSTAHYSIDVVDGKWKTSQGILDFDQTAADSLGKGEVMEVADISYKENRLDLRMVSVEAHKVTRGGLFKTNKREPVATNFKFFFPFPALDHQDVPKAVEYIGQYLRAFPTEDEARAFAARVVAGQEGRRTASATSGSRQVAASAGTSKKEIKAGMTPLEVLDVLGKPDKEVTFENKSRWSYPDLTVLFENGRVKEVKF
ncbi:MAG TPA: hypothetical protein VMR21_04105 [Vicinamibacteria bacterium]|nr:hypothetical protein [Vicinamibacteria bacterium]